MSQTPISTLKGLGPKSQSLLKSIGIESAEQVLASDPFGLYLQLKAQHNNINLNMLYALMGAIENKDWREIKRNYRTSILLRLDEINNPLYR